MIVLQDLKEKIDLYFGLGSIGILFLCALLFFLIQKEKSRTLKVYLYYLLIALFAMLNPISLYVIDKTGNMDVYERFFWLLLSPVLLAFTFAFLVQRRGRLLLPCLLLLVLSGRLVFTTTEYKPAENIEKVSEEAVLVSDIIMRDFENLAPDAQVEPNRMGIEAPRAIVTEPVNEDIRMYNANIELWYVRKNFGSFSIKKYNKIASLFTMDNQEIPVKTLVKGMKKYDFQYFVLGNWQSLTGNVYNYDITVIGQTENYTVYKYEEPQEYTLTQYADLNGYQCMSYTIESNKGGLLVVDGGRAWQSLALVDTIKEKGGRVDAWIITHPHDDHCGVLASVLEAEWDKSEIEIGQIYIGEMDYDAVAAQGIRSDTYGYLLGGFAGHENVTWLTAGDELDLLGLHMKVLHTCSDTVLANSENIMNDGSMVFKLSGQKRSVLFLADIGDNNEALSARITDASAGSEIGRMVADEILAAYPQDVKSDYVQMAHHGNSSLPDYFYEAIQPRLAFFDAPDWLMENKNKETGETSYYSTPHYRQLMERLGAEIVSYSSKRRSVTFR